MTTQPTRRVHPLLRRSAALQAPSSICPADAVGQVRLVSAADAAAQAALPPPKGGRACGHDRRGAPMRPARPHLCQQPRWLAARPRWPAGGGLRMDAVGGLGRGVTWCALYVWCTVCAARTVRRAVRAARCARGLSPIPRAPFHPYKSPHVGEERGVHHLWSPTCRRAFLSGW